jgi:hypothetical protein
VRESSAITQQISTVAMFVGIFFHVHEKVFDVRMLLGINVFCAAFGFCLLWVTRAESESSNHYLPFSLFAWYILTFAFAL